MILGNKECDEEIAYFMKLGKLKPYKKNCAFKTAEFDWERNNKPDEYYCWQGSRIPLWFE